MRFRAAFLTLLLAGCAAAGSGVPSESPRPMRVMSINLCTDQLVLALLPPERIASVTWLARDPGQSLLEKRARAVAVNRGLAEEVLDQKPDLVITGTFATPALRGILAGLGYPLLEVDHANSIEDVRRITRQVAAAVGERERGEALIAKMDRDLADLARDPGPAIPVVAWDRTGFSAGEGTLYDEILQVAGARNLVREPMALSYRRPDIEVLLEANPALLVQGSVDPRAASIGDDVTRHRLVRRYWGDRTLFIPQSYYVCGTPMLAEAALDLRRQLREAQDRAGPALPFAAALIPGPAS